VEKAAKICRSKFHHLEKDKNGKGEVSQAKRDMVIKSD
jgi:hypothetical protein